MRSMCIGLISVAALMMAVSGCEKDANQQGQARQETPASPVERPGQATDKAAEPAAAQPGATEQKAEPAAAAAKADQELELDLKTAEGSELEAEVTLTRVTEGVKVTIEVEDAKPGKLRVVMHDKSDCSNMAAMSMGEPLAMSHAAGTTAAGTTPAPGTTAAPGTQPTPGTTAAPGTTPTPAAKADATKPMGDLGTLTVDADGNGKLEYVIPGMNLDAGDTMSLIGKSLVIHEGDKSGRTNKSFGKPLACGGVTRS